MPNQGLSLSESVDGMSGICDKIKTYPMNLQKMFKFPNDIEGYNLVIVSNIHCLHPQYNNIYIVYNIIPSIIISSSFHDSRSICFQLSIIISRRKAEQCSCEILDSIHTWMSSNCPWQTFTQKSIVHPFLAIASRKSPPFRR